MKKIRGLFVMVIIMIVSVSAHAQKFNDKLDGPFATTRTFTVNGVCDMCKHRIEGAVRTLPGVWSASWNVEAHRLLVKYDRSRVRPNTIEKAVANVGHDINGVRASDQAYAALPDCCHYRKA